MEQTWRWFGEHDPITLDFVKQAGATGVVTALHHVPEGETWTTEEIERRKAGIEAAGLRWSVCESIPVPSGIKRGDRSAGQLIASWKDSLSRLGRAGVPVVCYNFMPVVDWTRTDLMFRLDTTGHALRFDMIDFVGYDVFVLKRPKAADDYTAAQVAAAESRIRAMPHAAVDRLERNIIAGLPGGAAAQTRASIAAEIASFDGIGAAGMRENLSAFLREVAPVAEEVGVRLAIHPDDPPFSLFGLPRIVSTAADLRWLLSAVDRPANGITLCAGSYGSRSDNDVLAIAAEFARHIHFAHLRNVTKQPDGSFFEAEHLEGDTDMIALVGILLREEARRRREGRFGSIPMRPDHGHLLGHDADRATNPGYSFIGRLKGLAELRGIMRTLEASLVGSEP
jgi:mannonate dehydratase